MALDKKITEYEMLSFLREREELLPPLKIREFAEGPLGARDGGFDAWIATCLPNSPKEFRFLVEMKSSSTPQIVKGAIAQIRAAVRPGENPMILVPYLSSQRLETLEREQMSGIDMCGNGIIIIPDRLLILRTGHKNRYPESRPLSNPFRGRSAMVGRSFLTQPHYNSLGELHDVIQENGAKLSLSQVSKAVKALEDELIVSSSGRAINLKDPLRLLDKLGSEWREPRTAKRALRVPDVIESVSRLSEDGRLEWAVTGESSVKRYTSFGQGRPLRVAVSDLRRALDLVDGKPENVPSFADLELLETAEAGFYFQNELDPGGLRWASRIQTWIELRNGDARQQDAAREIREQILRDVG